MRSDDRLDVRLGVDRDAEHGTFQHELGQQSVSLVNSCTLHHHIVMERWHEIAEGFFFREPLLEQSFINSLDHASVFVMKLGDEGMRQLWVHLFACDHLLDDVCKVILDEELNIAGFHFVDVFYGWEQTVIWLAMEYLF